LQAQSQIVIFGGVVRCRYVFAFRCAGPEREKERPFIDEARSTL